MWGEIGRSFRDNSAAAAATPKQEAAVPEAGQWELLWAQDLMCPRLQRNPSPHPGPQPTLTKRTRTPEP